MSLPLSTHFHPVFRPGMFHPNLIVRLAGGIGWPLSIVRMRLSLLGRLVMLLTLLGTISVW